jgi:hypothetical protein
MKSCKFGNHSNAKVKVLENNPVKKDWSPSAANYTVVECTGEEEMYMWMKKPLNLALFRRTIC